MGTSQKYQYVQLEVGGIQAFLFATGKLKEMIGASECVEAFTDGMFQQACEETNLRPVDSLKEEGEALRLPQHDRIYPLQQNAGTLRCLLADEKRAKTFVQNFSRLVLECHPGLPFFGASASCEYSKDGLEVAGRKLAEKIQRQRAEFPVPCGMSLLPFVETAPLDGLPAVQKIQDDYISLLSESKRKLELLKSANDRLKDDYNDRIREALQEHSVPVTIENIEWKDDLDIMLAGQEKKRVALIHMDGNDLGMRFRKAAENHNGDLAEGHKAMKRLSENIETAVQKAFGAAAAAAVKEDVEKNASGKPEQLLSKDGKYIVPLRPLVLGGDDITVIVRADLALCFIQTFAHIFERTTEEQGERCSLGAGMVVMPSSYPFLKAWNLCEKLCKKAKKATISKPDESGTGLKERPSSLDWLVITSEVDDSVDDKRLTCKPFVLDATFDAFLQRGECALTRLPRKHIQEAAELCREGEQASIAAYKKLKENIHRGLGGRHDANLLSSEDFEKLFKKMGSFFCERNDACPLSDWLELTHLGIGTGGSDA